MFIIPHYVFMERSKSISPGTRSVSLFSSSFQVLSCLLPQEWFYLTPGFLAHFNMPPSLPSRLGLWLVLVIEQCCVLLVILWRSSCSLIQIPVLAIWKIKYFTVSLHCDHHQYISISYQSLYCRYFNGHSVCSCWRSYCLHSIRCCHHKSNLQTASHPRAYSNREWALIREGGNG